eukprot:5873536-Prymnesium_polylepis.1
MALAAGWRAAEQLMIAWQTRVDEACVGAVATGESMEVLDAFLREERREIESCIQNDPGSRK